MMATFKGRRLPVVNGKPTWPTEPGDYCGPVYGYSNDRPAVFFLNPNVVADNTSDINEALSHVTSPPHTFRECEDGSLEIRNSILNTYTKDGVKKTWHGFLDEGHIWRQ